MIASPQHQRILTAVDEIPRTPSEIYRRLECIPPHKTLTSKRRRHRVVVARALEDMAEIGIVERAFEQVTFASGAKGGRWTFRLLLQPSIHSLTPRTR